MKNKITILGGGPAGLAIAYYSNQNNLSFNLYESSNRVGGNCITISHKNFLYDSGAHRLHDKDAETIKIIKNILGNDLKLIHVPSQIYRDGCFIDFPLSPLNLLKFLGLRNFIISIFQIIKEKVKKKSVHNSFHEMAINTYGKKISYLFLIYYTEKLWGLPTTYLSPEVAGKRLKGLNIKTFILEAFSKKIKKTAHLDGYFYYPKYGIGSIFEKMSLIFQDQVNLSDAAIRINHLNYKITSVVFKKSGLVPVDVLVSSLPIEKMIFLLNPSPPIEVIESAKRIKFRNIVLVSLFLNKKSINMNGSMYFPSKKYPFTRIYEPKNRSEFMSPVDKTSLIVEIPCQKEDDFWKCDDKKNIDRISSMLIDIGFFKFKDIIDAKVDRITHAYPVLEKKYKQKTFLITDYLSQFKNLKMTGRNGLFSYTHIHDHMINGRKIVDSITKNS
ncbi:MAG: hypothetical protein CL844_04650 [Crocinitomicaceae bacterium]|nr:hypothetical protein [Crocinitomicaceae bacterium]|tara:strand:- start:1546 stop:2874 length:1329 start_codon:yes stop_codon:yes gene_type:complete